MRRLVTPLVTGVALVAAAVVSMRSAPAEWPQWRGPQRTGVSSETGLLKQWPSAGPPLEWRATGAGVGYSSFAITGGRLFTMGARGNDEYVIAYDVTTGKRLWETAFGVRYRDSHGDGPRGTPTVDGNRLYVMGGSGDFACLEATTGRKLWGLQMTNAFSAAGPNWGYSESPLVVGDYVLVNAGGADASIVAFDKATGNVIWKSGSDPAAYSSAVLHELGGVREAIFFTATRALGVDVQSGRILWGYDRANNDVANISTPILRGNRVFISSDYGTGGALLELTRAGDGVTAREVYFTREMRTHHNTAVLIGDYLYGFSSTILTALKFDDGTVAWRDRSVGKGSLVAADGQLYLYSEDGVVGLADATPAGYRERGRFRLATTGSLPTWTHPVVVDGRLYLRDQDTFYAYDVRAR